MDKRTAWGRPGSRAAAEPGRPESEAIPPEHARLRVRRRPLRVVTGVAILGAIGLLWPFADWNWWPIVTGLGVLVALFVTRLDGLCRGWSPQLAGLVVVALLLVRTGPWVWGFAVGLAVLGYGLVRLPDWRLVAVGAALTAVFGVGYGLSQYRTAEQQAADSARTTADQAANVTATAAELLIPSITNLVAAGDGRSTCALLGPAAPQFAAAQAAPDCPSAVTRMAAQVSNPGAYRSPELPTGSIVKRPDGATVDGCRARWAGTDRPPGPKPGRFELRPHAGRAGSFLVVGYAPCP